MKKISMEILLFTNFYLPGYKGGGPIRTISNLLHSLKDEINFFLVTSDRDLGDKSAYPTIKKNTWINLDGTNCIYLSPDKFIFKVKKIISESTAHAINLNSFFSIKFSLLPLIFWRHHKANLPIILGPRGEFSDGALAIKSLRKKVFIFAVKKIGLYRNIIWHASTEHEANDIRKIFGPTAEIRIAIDIARPGDVAIPGRTRKEYTPLRIVFLSRITPMKNLLGAIEILKKVNSQITFDVYGPIENKSYWTECEQSIKHLPNNVKFRYLGTLNPNEVIPTLINYDLFLLPTLGENFGHVIAEAIAAGLPVLISKNTPWRDLADNSLGWDISLENTNEFIDCIELCCKKSPEEHFEWRKQIRSWAVFNIGNKDALKQNVQLFKNLRQTS